MDFYFSKDTALLDFRDRDIVTGEISFGKAILYGSKDGIKDLVHGYMARNKNLGVFLACLCSKELVSEVLSLNLGWKYATVWTGGRNIVVLFTKKLNT
jgi:hypothetical protein